jgi:hypothetical protein
VALRISMAIKGEIEQSQAGFEIGRGFVEAIELG